MQKLRITLALAAVMALGLSANADVPTAHAYQMGSTDSKWGFVSFPVNDLSALVVNKSTSSDGNQISAGEDVNGRYYSYTVYYDMLFGYGLEPQEFVIWNAANFTTISAMDTPTPNRVVDMTYDYTHNTMYALIEQNSHYSEKIGLTGLYVIDLTTGEPTFVGLPGDITAQNGYGNTVEEHLVALASNPTDGQLYAMGEYRQLYKLDRMTGLATAVGTRNRVAITNDFQSMAFAADGNLYLAQMHPDYEYFMRIDPATGALYNPVTGAAVVVNADFSNNAARFPHDPQLTGLWFEGKTYNDNVPAAVTNLTASVAPGNNPNVINISWQNSPARAQVSGINVYRFGTAEPIAQLAAGATSYTDNNAPNGDVSYYVVAQSAEGSGFPAWTTTFAGADQLKAVTNLNATLDGSNVSLSWNAPTATVDGGYSDYNNITYNITRILGSERQQIATGVTARTYSTTLPSSGTYSFEVVPVSCGIVGLAAVSNEVTFEDVLSVPYQTGFEDNDGGTLWTIINKGVNGWIIELPTYNKLEGKNAAFKTGGSATIPANDWFISPAIQCPQGLYELTYWAYGASYDNHTYKVYIGPDSTDPNDFTEVIQNVVDQKIYDNATANHYVEMNVNFSIPATGSYRIAFQGIGISVYSTLRIDNLSLICTQQTGLNSISTSGDMRYDAASRTILCPEATMIAAYDLSGKRIAATAGDALTIYGHSGVAVVKAITPTGMQVMKIVLR